MGSISVRVKQAETAKEPFLRVKKPLKKCFMLLVRCLNALLPAVTWEHRSKLGILKHLPNLGRSCWHPPKLQAAGMNLTGHCFIEADVLNGALFLLIFFTCLVVLKWGAPGAGGPGPRPRSQASERPARPTGTPWHKKELLRTNLYCSPSSLNECQSRQGGFDR